MKFYNYITGVNGGIIGGRLEKGFGERKRGGEKGGREGFYILLYFSTFVEKPVENLWKSKINLWKNLWKTCGKLFLYKKK